MSIKALTPDRNPRKRKKEVGEFEFYGIKIQCPDCGSIFILNEFGECYCPRCKRVYEEAEVRERCGL